MGRKSKSIIVFVIIFSVLVSIFTPGMTVYSSKITNDNTIGANFAQPTKGSGIETFMGESETVTENQDQNVIKEDEIKVLNGDGYVEKVSWFELSFTPKNTAVYKITANGPEIPNMNINEGNTSLQASSSYPEKSNAMALKLFKDRNYKIVLSSVSLNGPTELLVSQFKSNNTSLNFKFANNTYTENDNASVIATVLSAPADIVFGILERDIIIKAQLLKDGTVIDEIPAISSECIMGKTHTPDDNMLQFACDFSKHVKEGEYTVKIDLEDNLQGNPMIKSYQSNVKIGNCIDYYIPSDKTSFEIYNNAPVLYFDNDNISSGKFILLDENNRTIGTSSIVNVRSDSISYDDSRYYQTTPYKYNFGKFSRYLRCASLDNMKIYGKLEKEKAYSIEFVSGLSEYKTSIKLISTDELILESTYIRSFNENYLTVEQQFSNFKNVDMDDLRVDLMDDSGNIVASHSDYGFKYSSNGLQTISFNFKFSKPLEMTRKYYLKTNYKGKIYSNVRESGRYPDKGYTAPVDKLNLGAVEILDIDSAIIKVPSYACDKTLNYDVTLYRKNDSVPNVAISEIIGAKPDKDGVFVLKFPQKAELPLLFLDARYNLCFKYTDSNKEVNTYNMDFKTPAQSVYSENNKQISFYPPVLPSIGEAEFSLVGYEIENGILGADNENINIELVSENEVYGSLKKDTIKRDFDKRTNRISISGTIQVNKQLKDETQYYIRIKGTDYKYFFYSVKEVVSQDLCTIEHWSGLFTSEEKQPGYVLSQTEPLELSCKWVRNVSDNMKLVLVSSKTNEEFEAGTWDKGDVHYNEEYVDISIKANLSNISLDKEYEAFLKAGETKYRLNKFVKLAAPEEIKSFSVVEAVYGSDVITVEIPSYKTYDGICFKAIDSLDRIIDFNIINGSDRKASNKTTYVDLTTKLPLKQGEYTLRLYNSNKYILQNSYLKVLGKSPVPDILYVESGSPYIIHGMNLVEDGEYTADISTYNDSVMVKRNIPLLKKPGEDVLELYESSTDGLEMGTYFITVKVNGTVIGSKNLYISLYSSQDIKPLILPEEWAQTSAKRPFIISSSVKFIIKSMYFTKMRYSESVEDLQTKEYEPIKDRIDYKFNNPEAKKTLFFQFKDDSMKESEVITFNAYLQEKPGSISVISPKDNTTYNTAFTMSAVVPNNPIYVYAKLYSMLKYSYSNSYYYNYFSTVQLVREANTDIYSLSIDKTNAASLAKVEFYSVDAVGNISDVKTVVLKELPKELLELTIKSLPSATNNSKITISGTNAKPESKLSIYVDNSIKILYSTEILANNKGEFEGVVDIQEDGYYGIKIYANDATGNKYNEYSIRVDKTAPVLKNYDQVAQGIKSARISWDVTDSSDCTYTIWRDGEIIASSYRYKEYIAVGLEQGKAYKYKIMATDIVGNNSIPVEIIVTVGDNEVPSVPQNLHVISHAGKSITLSWNPSKDNYCVSGYEIMRNGVKVGTSYTTSYTDSFLTTGTEYSYSIKAFDSAMNYSEPSETIDHTPIKASIKDMYEGSYDIADGNVKKLDIKFMSNDILNDSDKMASFYYSKDKGEWKLITSYPKETKTPEGILFSAVWDIENYADGEYIIKYVFTDRDNCSTEAFSQAIRISKMGDTTAPQIKSISPQPSCYAKTIPVKVIATDNTGVKSITLQGSIDGLVWNDIKNQKVESVSKEYTFSYNVDVSNVKEGAYFIRAVASDAAGNTSSKENASFNQYIIDRTPPEKVKGLKALSGASYIELRWDNNSELYIGGFNVMRSESEKGEYISIANNVMSLNFFDKDLVKGKKYSYKVVCVDLAGNKGEFSDIVEAKTLDTEEVKDDIAPQIISFYPENGANIGNKVQIGINASDNNLLSKIILQFSLDGNSWSDLEVKDTEREYDGLSFNWDTSAYKNDTILKTRAYAVDIKGNKSSFQYSDYKMDNKEPEKPTINLKAMSRSIEVSWKCNDEDILSYKVYRRTVGSEFLTVVGEYDKSTLLTVNKNLDPSLKYIYKVIAIDNVGNSSFAESSPVSPLDIDDISPKAIINCITSAETNASIEFDATSSSDNVKIAKYEWDFGDGTKSEGVITNHSYIKAGEYNVSLTVIDSSGNSSKSEVNISVLEKELLGTLNITVVDESYNKLPYTDVFVNLGSEVQYKKASDYAGSMSLKLEKGSYKIGAYKSGYSPAQQEILIQEGKSNDLQLVLKKSELVVGSITSSKMSLSEIKEAGIDTSLPGSYNAFKYSINLMYNNQMFTLKGFCAPKGITQQQDIELSGGGRLKVEDREVEVSVGGSQNNPIVLVLDLPGSVSWLKDFFDVRLQVLNKQGNYAINQASVKLNLPEGLTLVSGIENVCDIPANTTREFSWVVRGDRSGSYNLSADFKGILESFNEEISATFNSKFPIKVESTKGLKVYVDVENAKYQGQELLYRVGFYNGKNSEIYYPAIKMKDSELRSYKTTQSMSLLDTSMSVLKPGEILWKEYSIKKELYEGKDYLNLWLKEYTSKALNGMNIPIEIRPVSYGTFGRVKTQIYVIDPVTGKETIKSLTLIKYKNKSKKADKMPKLKIKSTRGISKDVLVGEKVNLKLIDGLYGGVLENITTDEKGEYVYIPQNGGSIEDITIGDTGIKDTTIQVQLQSNNINAQKIENIGGFPYIGKNSKVQYIRLVDESKLPYYKFGSISGRVINLDTKKAICDAKIIIGAGEPTSTDDNGFFSFKDILFGDNIITVKANGFPETKFEKFLTDGSFYTLQMAIKPGVKRITSKYSDSDNVSNSILPFNLFSNDSITFDVEAIFKEKGDRQKYHYKIVDKTGKKKYDGYSDTNTVTINEIKSKMLPGDRLLFAVEIKAESGSYKSDYIDSKLVMAPRLTLLEGVFNIDTNKVDDSVYDYTNNAINGVSSYLDFWEGISELFGEEVPFGKNVPFAEAYNILRSLNISIEKRSFPANTSYNFTNGTFTIKSTGGINGGEAGVDLMKLTREASEKISSVNVGVGADINVEFETVFTYNNSIAKWELTRLSVDYGQVGSITFGFDFPVDGQLKGVVLSATVSVTLGGKIKTYSVFDVSQEDIEKVKIDNAGIDVDSLPESVINILSLMKLVNTELSISLRSSLGGDLVSGLYDAAVWNEGNLVFKSTMEEDERRLQILYYVIYGVEYSLLWFFASDDIPLGGYSYVLYDSKNEGAALTNLNADSLFLSPTENSKIMYNSSSRDYLNNQEWIGKDVIQKNAYPQSEAQIAPIKNGSGELMMLLTGDDSKRTGNNRTSVQSSIYKNGTWSKPVQIDDDGTADAMPKLAADGDNIYVAWLDMSEEIGDLADVTEDYISENVLAKMGISLSKYDKNSNSWTNVLTKRSDGLNKLPEVAADSGKIMLTWVNNAGKKLTGNPTSNDCIYYMFNDGKGWTEPQIFVKGASNVFESDLYMYEGKVYYVYVTDAYSQDGLKKLYLRCFDGAKWSLPEEIIDNDYDDSSPVIEIKNNEPMVFWKNEGKIYEVSLDSPYNPQVIVNSEQAQNICELTAANTNDGAALSWTSIFNGQRKLFISTFDNKSSTWTPGTEILSEPMEIVRDVTLAGIGNSVMAVYNKTTYIKNEKDQRYYNAGTSLISSIYTRKTDVAVVDNGIYLDDMNAMPGTDTEVMVAVKNTGDVTAEKIKVSLFEKDTLIGSEEIDVKLIPNSEALTGFKWTVPENYSGIDLKAVVEAANDVDSSNNGLNLEKSYTDAEITSVYNEVYSENAGIIHVSVRNIGYSDIKNAVVTIASDKEFKNVIASKNVGNLNQFIEENVYFIVDQKLKNMSKIYAKVESDSKDSDYSNNIRFTVIHEYEEPAKIDEEITISGYIKSDLSNEASNDLSGFVVEVAGKSVYTNINGFFSVEGVKKADSYTISIKKKDYLERSINVKDINKNISLGTNEKPIEIWVGDIDNDGSVNMIDVFKLAKRFNSVKGDSIYDESCDLNKDGVIDMIDVTILAKHFNCNNEDYSKVEVH